MLVTTSTTSVRSSSPLPDAPGPRPSFVLQRAAYAYDPYYGGMMAYGQQTMVAPHMMGGLQSARMMLPSEMEEEPAGTGT